MGNQAAARIERSPRSGSRRPLGLGYLIREVYRAFTRRLDSQLEAYSVSHSQWVSMLLLSNAGTMTPLELARAVGIRKASATAVIETLRARDFLVAERDPQDGRKLNLSLTIKGIDAVEQMSACIDETSEQIQAGLTQQERETFKRLLIRITQNAKANDGGSRGERKPARL